ncbi:uncharacterized protein L3040_003074 [Drepanopeziza brunnea f. sp. 'multigermtubi']|uniref:uncharacterized protein n=1 Tax=Drepanopeziza brunnea f. sp. 'multigermtubi' TaxID=698441 RepID=UPI00238D865E|nr:hypothetical protein L3040_003074 [Drepanopeziza brunnea f. sp. 'multigermtubi']
MHQKALLFTDTIVASQILASKSPKEQKALGRQGAKFDDDVWKQNRERIVEEASYWKFKIGRDEGELKGKEVGMRRMLEGTEGSQIVEASPRDRI